MRRSDACSGRIVAVLLAAMLLPAATAQIAIVAPDAGTEIAGTVEVTVAGAADAEMVHVRVGDRPWVAATKAGDQWRASLDTTLVSNGPTTIAAQAWPAGEGTSAAVEVTLRNGLNCYWGDLHSHTSVSDGQMRPMHAYAYARDVAGMDIFSLTDHLEKVDEAEWRECLRAADLANVDGDFVALAGLEWSKRVGHLCVYDPAGFVWPTDLEDFYEFGRNGCAVAKFNHPGWRDTTFNDFAYSEAGDQFVQMMEVRNSAEMAYFIEALDLGWHVAPDGSSDTHGPKWGNTGRWTVVLAPGLSRTAVIEALQSRHCYSTLDRNCRMYFSINEATMGDIMKQPVTMAKLIVDISDPDEEDAIDRIELFADGVVTESIQPGASNYRWELDLRPEPGEHYYFVKVTQADGQPMWSAPIWLTAPAQ